MNEGGISLPFFVLNELYETLRWAKCVAQPRKRAPNNYKKKYNTLRSFSCIYEQETKYKLILTFSKVIPVEERSKYSKTFGCAKKLCKFCKIK